MCAVRSISLKRAPASIPTAAGAFLVNFFRGTSMKTAWSWWARALHPRNLCCYSSRIGSSLDTLAEVDFAWLCFCAAATCAHSSRLSHCVWVIRSVSLALTALAVTHCIYTRQEGYHTVHKPTWQDSVRTPTVLLNSCFLRYSSLLCARALHR